MRMKTLISLFLISLTNGVYASCKNSLELALNGSSGSIQNIALALKCLNQYYLGMIPDDSYELGVSQYVSSYNRYVENYEKL